MSNVSACSSRPADIGCENRRDNDGRSEQSFPALIRFGSYLVITTARVLLRNGTPVEVGSRAFDLLLALLHARGEIVSVRDLMQKVWPNTTVVEANLRVQLSCLRQALGKDRWRIKTVQCRGYFMITGEAPPIALPPQPVNKPCRYDEPAFVIVAGDAGSRERLRRVFSEAGIRMENLPAPSAMLGSEGLVAEASVLPSFDSFKISWDAEDQGYD